MVNFNEAHKNDKSYALAAERTLEAVLLILQGDDPDNKKMSLNQACHMIALECGMSMSYVKKMHNKTAKISLAASQKIDIYHKKLIKSLASEANRKQFIVAVNFENEERRDRIKKAFTNAERIEILERALDKRTQ